MNEKDLAGIADGLMQSLCRLSREGWSGFDCSKKDKDKDKKLLFVGRNMSKAELCVNKKGYTPYCTVVSGFESVKMKIVTGVKKDSWGRERIV